MVDPDHFDISLRGYVRSEVDALFDQLTAAFAAPGQQTRSDALHAVRQARFTVVFRGYHRKQVDQFVSMAEAELQGEAAFQIVVRGYDPAQVDDVVGVLKAAADSSDRTLRLEALQRAERASFAVVMRGYDRAQVDAYLGQAQSALRS